MLFLFLAMVLNDAQQTQHDRTEWAIYQRVQADEAAIADIWRPNPKLLADYRTAHKCYVQFHLYRVAGCSAQFAKVDRDLGHSEAATNRR